MDRINRKQLNFIHIAKCGGTSLKLTLDNLFDEDEIYPYYFSWQIYKHGKIDPKSYSLIRGHLGIQLWDKAGLPENLFVWLREPRDRLISAYWFRRQKKSIPENMSFRDWLDKYLLKQGFVPSLIGWLIYGAVFREDIEYVGAQPDMFNRIRDPDSSVIEQAQGILNRCFMIGLQEKFQESLNLLHYHLGSLPAKAMPHANRTHSRRGSEELTAEDLALLDEVLLADRQVYEYGCELFQEQYRSMKRDLAARYGLELDGKENESDLIKSTLRRQFFRQELSTPVLKSIDYSFNLKLIGNGWLERERIETDPLNRGTWRWIDCTNGAEIFFRLYLTRPAAIFVGICHAVKIEFLDTLEVTINDEPPLALKRARERHNNLHSEWVLSGIFDITGRRQENHWLKVTFYCPDFVVPAYQEDDSLDFRELNVALNWIAIRPLSESYEFDDY